MNETTLLGGLVVGLGGFIMGSGSWPFKLMKKYQFEHWWFVGMLVGLIIMPWTITLLGCPNAIEGIKSMPWDAIKTANIFAFGWGIANVLCGICFVRIGVALTGAVLGGLGVSVGTIIPLVFKGSGLFKDSPGLNSPAGLTVLVGVGVMLLGVITASIAGFGRDRELKKTQATSGGFLGGLIMTAIAGVLSTGTTFAFVYAQDPILANLSTVRPNQSIKVTVEGKKDLSGKYDVSQTGTIDMKGMGTVTVTGGSARQAADRIGAVLAAKPQGGKAEVRVETGDTAAAFGVWAIGLSAGALVNIVYAVYLLTKNKSWGVLTTSGWEFFLAIIIGVNFSVAVTLMGKGMLLLGALGGSVGWGIQQAMQMTGGQVVGFVSGEWKAVHGKPRTQMYVAISILMFAALVMAYGNTLSK